MSAEAILDGSPQMAGNATPAPRQGGYRRACPECLTVFHAPQPGQIFCCTGHKRAYNNRWMKRGAVLAPIFVAARVTRNGTRGDRVTGARANDDANRLEQRWRDEDMAAGRMPTVEYMALRYRLGMVEVTR